MSLIGGIGNDVAKKWVVECAGEVAEKDAAKLGSFIDMFSVYPQEMFEVGSSLYRLDQNKYERFIEGAMVNYERGCLKEYVTNIRNILKSAYDLRDNRFSQSMDLSLSEVPA